VTVVIAAADDPDAHDRLLATLAELGARFEDGDLGVGLSRFEIAGQSVTVYRDAWHVDLEGPEELVTRIVELLQ
jgi:hypothetical protein